MSLCFVTLLKDSLLEGVCAMPKDISSTRITRLNSLVLLMGRGSIAKSILLKGLGYKNISTFERDIKYLRQKFDVDVNYDRKTKSYCLMNSGSFPPDDIFSNPKGEVSDKSNK